MAGTIRRTSAVLRRCLSSASSGSQPAGTTRIPLHQPLGVPPPGTDPLQVRSKWGSDAMELIQAAPPIEVSGAVATCNGGGGPLGHPLEYIQINRADAKYPAICKYCGNKFIPVQKR